MSALTPDTAEKVAEAARNGAQEAADALGRALDATLTLSVGDPAAYDASTPPAGLAGGGLAVVLTFGEVGAAIVLPESSGLAPAWAPAPDPTGQSKLATLAQELSMLLVPEDLIADGFEAAWAPDLAGALARGAVADAAAVLPLSLKSDAAEGTLWMIWPLAEPGEVLAAAQAAAPQQPRPTPEPTGRAAGKASPPTTRIFDFSQLPPYSRSLLRVRVPVQVLLAGKKQEVREIMALGPGSILTFDRPCDAPLAVQIGEQTIAEGEAVKVGEKFGVKIREMLLPPEHFKPVVRRACQ